MRPAPYLDYAATTPVHAPVVAAMAPYWSQEFGNPASMHAAGQRARAVVEQAREKILRTLSMEDNSTLVFTSGATEANNLAIQGMARQRASFGKHIVVSSVEHQSVLATCRQLVRDGFRVSCIPVDEDGIVDLSRLQEALSKDTQLISVMSANNETGVMQPIREVAKIARQSNIPFHTDAAQAIGKSHGTPQHQDVDLITISAHKLGGPKGVGCLIISGSEVVFPRPILHGGHQEYGIRAGTLPVPLIVGMATAVELAQDASATERTRGLRDYFESQLRRVFGRRVVIHGREVPRAVHISNFRVEQLDAIQKQHIMDKVLSQMSISTTAACVMDPHARSHVLTAMGIRQDPTNVAFRASFCANTRLAEIDFAIDVFKVGSRQMTGWQWSRLPLYVGGDTTQVQDFHVHGTSRRSNLAVDTLPSMRRG